MLYSRSLVFAVLVAIVHLPLASAQQAVHPARPGAHVPPVQVEQAQPAASEASPRFATAPPAAAASPVQQPAQRNVGSAPAPAYVPAAAAAPAAGMSPAIGQQPVTIAPMRPEFMAPAAPQVGWQNGQLSIVSRNSTMADILQAVRQQTGAVIEGPLSGANDRVAAHLGPGPADDVIAQLLKGSRYDYMILGSNAQSGQLKRIVLTLRNAGGATSAAAPGTPLPPSRPSLEPDDDAVQEEPENPAANDQQEFPAVNPPLPLNPAGNTGPPNNPDDSNRVKTPEELLQELQRMQQIQQQQQQQNQIGEPLGHPIVPQFPPTTVPQRDSRPPR